MTTRKSFRLSEPETHGAKSDGEAVAVLEGLRASALQAELRALRRHVSLLQNSRSWKLTRPLRWGNALFRGRLPGGMQLSRLTRHFAMTRQEYGLMAAGREIADNLRTLIADIGRARRSTDLFGACSDSERAVYALPPTPPSKVLRPRFLIIATLDLPQCVKYRVDQKAGMLRAMGWDVCIVDWNDVCSAMSALQMASEVIFYRTPATADILALIDESRRLGLSPRWEVDDLIFDEAAYRANGNLAALTRREKLHLLDDSALYKECLLACGRGLASTPALAKAMRDVGVQDVVVIENALDKETLATAQALAVSHLRHESDRIVIFYGSGSRAHDVDFLEAEEGLIAAMRADSRLCLHVVGSVRLSGAFAAFGTRVRHTDAMSYRCYLAELAQADISITPLEPSIFNDAKSTIRFIEASIVGLPSVCSPTASYADVIVDGSNGFLAKDSRSWADRLLRLARDPALRRGLAEAGRHSVLDRYSPGRIIEDQIVPAYGRPALLQRESRVRVVMPNVFFAPRSFGGATVVVESLVDPLAICGCEVSVLTTRASIRDVPDGALRYHAKGVDVLAAVPGMKASVFNADIGDDLACWIDAWDADIVHFHAIQELGMGMARACLEKNVPYVVTLHDCWWLADDLFIRKDDGSYQLVTPDDEKTPPRSPHDVYLDARRVLSYEVLMNAALLLSPSEEHKALYVRNGIPAERIVINRNGFRWPERPHRRRDVSAPLRFGYVGGASAVKGYDLIHEALSALSRSDWELVLVDNTLNVGFPSIDPSKWKDVAGTVTIVPAYTQDGLDDFYDTVDVLLFPSQWRESYGLSVREALSRDVWVIATTPGGQAEEIVEGVNGNLIPLDTTPQDLQGAILALLERPEAFTDYHNPLKSRLPTYTRQAEELYAFYREILNRKSDAGLR